MSMTTWRVAVVGGGLSGLAAAHRLIELCEQEKRPLDLVLYESGPRLGGVIGTRPVAGYRAELGADSFITNKPWGVDLCRRLGIDDRLIPTDARYRRSLVLHRGKPVAVPDGFQLLAPVDVGAVLRSPLFSWPGKLRMALEYFVPRGAPADDESLASFVRRRFGREALEPAGAAPGRRHLHFQSRTTLAAGDNASLSRHGARAWQPDPCVAPATI